MQTIDTEASLLCQWLSDPGQRFSERERQGLPEAWDKRTPMRSRGVSMAFLQEFRAFLVAHDREDSCAGQIVHGYHTTASGRDFSEFDLRQDTLCVRGWTLQSGLSLVETLQTEGVATSADGRPLFGEMNAFVSYTWRNPGVSFVDLIDALTHTVEVAAEEDLFFFIDIFTCAQNRPTHSILQEVPCPQDEDVNKGQLADVIAACRSFCFHTTPLKAPAAFGRAWCLFELMHAGINKIPVTVILGPRDEQQLLEDVSADRDFINSLFGRISARQAKATVTHDLEEIFKLIQDSIGFEEVDRMVKDQMRDWISDTLPRLAEGHGDDPRLLNGIGYVFQVAKANVIRQSNIGQVERELGHYQVAKEWFEKSLTIRLSVHGDGHPDVAASYNNLGQVERDLGDYKASKEWHEKCLAIWLVTLGESHMDVADLYNKLGIVEFKLGDLAAASEWYRKSLDIRIKILGVYHPEVAASYNNIGVMEKAIGNIEGAKDAHQKSLEIKKATLGEMHPDVAISYTNLGTVEKALGNFEAAKQWHMKSLDIKLATGRASNASIAAAYNNLGTIEHDLGHYEAAKVSYHKSLDLKLNMLGPQHPDIARLYMNLGAAERNLGHFDEAKEFCERGLDIRRSALRDEHPVIASSYVELGVLESLLGDYVSAKKWCEKGLHILQSTHGDNTPHVSTANAMNSLGNIEGREGHLEESRHWLERTLQMRLANPGDEQHLIAAYHNLGTVEALLGNHGRAQELYEEGIRLSRDAGVPHPQNTATLFHNFGNLERLKGRTEEARELYEQGLSVLAEVPGHPFSALLREGLGALSSEEPSMWKWIDV